MWCFHYLNICVLLPYFNVKVLNICCCDLKCRPVELERGEQDGVLEMHYDWIETVLYGVELTGWCREVLCKVCGGRELSEVVLSVREICVLCGSY